MTHLSCSRDSKQNHATDLKKRGKLPTDANLKKMQPMQINAKRKNQRSLSKKARENVQSILSAGKM